MTEKLKPNNATIREKVCAKYCSNIFLSASSLLKYYYNLDQIFWCPNLLHMEGDQIFLSRGLAENILDMSKVKDDRVSKPYSFNFNGSLYGFQKEAIEAMAEKENGIVCAPTGSGKTFLAFGAAHKIGQKTMFVTHTTEIASQTIKKAEEVFGEPCGFIGGGSFNIRPFTVALIQTLRGCKESIFDDFGMVIQDECVTGDSVVVTEKGPVKIEDISTLSCKKVLTCEDNQITMKPIVKHWCSGIKPVYEIETIAGEKIRCTGNHLVMTSSGWKKAKKIKAGESVLTTASVDVAKNYTEIKTEERENMCLATKCEEEATKNGKKDISKRSNRLLFASVDVVKRYLCDVAERLKNLLTIGELKDTTNISMATTKGQKDMTYHYPRKKWVLLSERFLETLLYLSQIKDRKMLGSLQIIRQNNYNGLNTKRKSFINLIQKYKSETILDMAKNGHHYTRLVCQKLLKHTKKFIKKALDISAKNCYTSLEPLGWLGGFATTGLIQRGEYHYIPIATTGLALNQQGAGLKKHLVDVQYIKTKEQSMVTFVSAKKQQEKLSNMSLDIYQNVCDTKYSQVKRVTLCGEEKVYDITVEDTHCFFANGILVHNCHHIPADTFAETMSKCPAKYRFGLTATLTRKDGLEGITKAILGDIIFNKDITSKDIQEHISIPKVVKVQTEYDMNKATFCFKKCKYHGHCKPLLKIKDSQTKQIDWAKLKKGSCKLLDFNFWKEMLNDFISDEKRNALISEVYTNNKGKYNLILTERVEHAVNLGNILRANNKENIVVLHGSINKYERDAEIEKFKSNGGTICATTKLFGEGFDAPDIDRLFLVTPSANAINIKQKIGRIMRKKDVAPVVYDFVDKAEITESAWWKRFNIYKKMGIEVSGGSKPKRSQNENQSTLFV